MLYHPTRPLICQVFATMSVWESTTYKLDIARAIYEHIPSFMDKVLGKSAGAYLKPKGDLCPICPEDSWEDVAAVCGWGASEVHDDDRNEVGKLITHVHRWSIGMQGVYLLIQSAYEGHFDVKDQYNYAQIDKRVQSLGVIVCASTMITPEAFMNKWTRKAPDLLSRARRFESFSEGWKFFARGFKSKSLEFTEIDQDKYFGMGNRMYYGGTLGPLLIMVGSGEFKDKGLIMTRQHVDVLIGASARIGCLLDHAAREHFTDKSLQIRILRILEMTIHSGGRSRGFDTDKVVQAYHKARSFVQMQLFENAMDDALTEAQLEFQQKGLQTVMNLPRFVDCFLGVPKGRWLELLHIYKWMPPPDFDATYAFTDLYEYHTHTRKSGLDPDASDEMKRLWKLIVKERKLNIAVAFKRLNKKWPESLSMTGEHPTSEQLDMWEPRDLFPYYTYGKDVTAQVKDKTTVLAHLLDEVNFEDKRPEKNFLLWYLMNKDRVDTTVIAHQLLHGGLPEENYVRVAYKGEAHKPGSRLFFMAPPLQRIILGELEGNISRIASQYPASLQGTDALTRAEKLSKLFSIGDESSLASMRHEYTEYIVTFDLSKFSPKFNPAVLQDLHSFWASVFGYKAIVPMGRIGSQSIILHTTNRLVMSYQNEGADLEGFRGRMMTLFHADMISAACRYALDKGYIVGKALSAVFIDDGAVKIAAKGRGDTAMRNALNFLKCMQSIYEAAGQENHPNKTIVSPIGGELLAEQYVYGQRLKCPIKAAMRLFPGYDIPATAITDEFGSLFATSQGAVKDGGDWIVAYCRLAESYIKAIHRWDRKNFAILEPVKLAFKLITPKSMGGFGFPSLQALVSTTAYDLTSEGLGMLSAVAKMYERYVPDVNRIIGRPVVLRDPLQILRDPGRVRLQGPILVEGRLTNSILKRLSNKPGPWSKLIVFAHQAEVLEHANQVAIALLSQDSVSLPVLMRVWDSTPLSYLEGILQKFKRAASVVILLAPEEIARVRRANQNDVSKLLRAFY